MLKGKPESVRTQKSEPHVGSEMRPKKMKKMTSEQATTVTTNSQTVTIARPLRAPGETKQEATEEDAAEQETLEGIGKRDSPKGDRGPEKRPKRISAKQN